MELTQYRITVNDTVGATVTALPASWPSVVAVAEERGYYARLERRHVFGADPDYRAGLTDPAGFLFLKDKIITPWAILAEATYA